MHRRLVPLRLIRKPLCVNTRRNVAEAASYEITKVASGHLKNQHHYNNYKHVFDKLVEVHPDETWRTRLRLINQCSDIRRVAVVGDSQSGASALVSSLLDNPLSSDHELHTRIISRHGHGTEKEGLFIQYGARFERHGNRLALPVDLLRNGMQIVEVSQLSTGNVFDTLYTCDVIFLVTDNIRLLTDPALIRFVREFASKPQTYILVNRITTNSISQDDLQRQIVNQFPTGVSLPVHFIATPSALSANNALRQSTSSQNTSVYQREWLSSGLNDVQNTMETLIVTSHVDLLEFAATQALNRFIVRNMEQTNELDDVVQVALEKIEEFVYKTADSLENELKKADLALLDRGYKELLDEMKATFERRLAFYKLTWKIDDVGYELRRAISSAFFRDLERQLLYNAGFLSASSSYLFQQTKDNIRRLSEKRLHHLQQPPPLDMIPIKDSSTESSRLTVAPLTQTHLAHLLSTNSGPVTELEKDSQLLLLRSVGIQVATLGFTLFSVRYAQPELFMPMLETEGGLNNLFITIGSSFTLSTLVGLRYLQTRWRKMSMTFLQTWIYPLRNKMEQDLKESREETIRDHVNRPSLRLAVLERRRWESTWLRLENERVLLRDLKAELNSIHSE